MFEVFFEPTTNDEKGFRHALWLLSGFIIHEKYPVTSSEYKSDSDEAQIQIQEIRNRIINTHTYQQLSPSHQKEILKGKRVLNWERIAKKAGFSLKTFRQLFSFQSSYIHSDGLSGTQIITAKTSADQIELLEIQMKVTMIIMSKMILDYIRFFPESKYAAEKDPYTYNLVRICSSLANKLP